MSSYANAEDLSAHLHDLSSRLRSEADLVWQMRGLGDASRVLTNLLRCTARQIDILDASANLPIEVAAGACRTVFEVNIRARLVTSNAAHLQDFQVERVFDEIDLWTRAKQLAHEGSSGDAVAVMDARIDELQQIVKQKQLTNPKSTVKQRACAAGVEAEYERLYGLYSKYVHASSWLVNTDDRQRDGEDLRNVLAIQTQRYAGDTLYRVQQFVSRQPAGR